VVPLQICDFTTRNTITEIETFHEHCLSTELELDDREGMGAEYILYCQYCETTIDTKSAIECKNCTNWHHAELAMWWYLYRFVILLLVIFCSSLSLFVMAMFSTISCLGSVSS
jgi:hypothetical protein